MLTRVFPILALIISLSGCFRMGIPEHIASTEQAGYFKSNTLRRPPTILLVTPSTETQEQTSYGHQFAFFIFPVTRTYFQHSAEANFLELLIDSLIQSGASVLITTPEDAEHIAHVASPDLILRASLIDFRLDAFDALFLRILRSKGLYLIEILNRNGNGVLKQISIPLDSREIRRSGHALFLALLAEKAFRDGFEEHFDLEELSPLFRSSRRTQSNESASPKQNHTVIIAPPKVATELNPTALNQLAQSYGFPEVADLTALQVSRVIQRGFSNSTQILQTPSASSLQQPMIDHADSRKPVWIVNSEVESLTIDEETNLLTFSIRLVLREQISGRESLLITRTCKLSEPQARGVDGAWISTLQVASQKLLNAFLSSDEELCTP